MFLFCPETAYLPLGTLCARPGYVAQSGNSVTSDNIGLSHRDDSLPTATTTDHSPVFGPAARPQRVTYNDPSIRGPSLLYCARLAQLVSDGLETFWTLLTSILSSALCSEHPACFGRLKRPSQEVKLTLDPRSLRPQPPLALDDARRSAPDDYPLHSRRQDPQSSSPVSFGLLQPLPAAVFTNRHSLPRSSQKNRWIRVHCCGKQQRGGNANELATERCTGTGSCGSVCFTLPSPLLYTSPLALTYSTIDVDHRRVHTPASPPRQIRFVVWRFCGSLSAQFHRRAIRGDRQQ
ncbi:hypothetical protein C8F01DRAFT_1301390 [Mycena amicta]|nr:hypothetical protein C8F01DRAFT_1301390 [Mycena amicta]